METEDGKVPPDAGGAARDDVRVAAARTPSTTVGTGTVIALGCIAVVLLILVLAVVAKVRLGVW